MVGDRHYDIIGAHENGVHAVAALWGYGSKAELAAAGARDFAESPDDFRQRYVHTTEIGTASGKRRVINAA